MRSSGIDLKANSLEMLKKSILDIVRKITIWRLEPGDNELNTNQWLTAVRLLSVSMSFILAYTSVAMYKTYMNLPPWYQIIKWDLFFKNI